MQEFLFGINHLPYLAFFLARDVINSNHYLRSQPNEIQQAINEHEDEIRSEKDIHRLVELYKKKA